VESRYQRTNSTDLRVVVPYDEGEEIEVVVRAIGLANRKRALALKWAYVFTRLPLERKCRHLGVAKSQYYRLRDEGEQDVRAALHPRRAFQAQVHSVLEMVLEDIRRDALRNLLTAGEMGEQNRHQFS
jgi:hypothetical protein